MINSKPNKFKGKFKGKEYIFAPEKNPLREQGITKVDYKDVNLLKQFLTDRGKIRSRELTGVTVNEQRKIANAVKNAREMALLPYISVKKG